MGKKKVKTPEPKKWEQVIMGLSESFEDHPILRKEVRGYMEDMRVLAGMGYKDMESLGFAIGTCIKRHYEAERVNADAIRDPETAGQGSGDETDRE